MYQKSYACCITAPPILVANIRKYTTTLGSQITLICDIIDRGMPPAKFGWKRDGHYLKNEYLVSANDSAISLTLSNVTLANAGSYICTATNAGLSYRTDTIELNIERK